MAGEERLRYKVPGENGSRNGKEIDFSALKPGDHLKLEEKGVNYRLLAIIQPNHGSSQQERVILLQTEGVETRDNDLGVEENFERTVTTALTHLPNGLWRTWVFPEAPPVHQVTRAFIERGTEEILQPEGQEPFAVYLPQNVRQEPEEVYF